MLEIPGYKIEKQLGKGGMARVYLALHKGLDRHVAIKVMSKNLDDDDDTSYSQRFISEARIVAKLSHVNIITVYDVGVHDGHHYIAMELVPGENLDDKIKKGLDEKEALIIMKQIASALDFAHSKHIIHRDIKPENILFREDGTAILADFGIAKATESTSKMTATGAVIGTPHYMSPEQAQGKEIGSYSDFYSLGVVFYEMLTGKVPYDADSTIAIVFKHITEPVPPLDAAHAKYQPLLDTLLAKDHEDRYHSGREIITDIECLERGETPANATAIFNATEINPAISAAASRMNKAERPQSEQKKGNSKLYLGLALVFILIAAGTAGGYFYNQNGTGQQTQQAQQAQQAKQEAQQAELEAQQAKQKAQRAELEAQQAKQKAQRAELEAQRAEQVKQLLSKAKKSFVLEYYAIPENKNAYYFYQQILKLEPENQAAQEGIKNIEDQLLKLANSTYKNKQYKKSQGYLAQLELINFESSNTKLLRDKVNAILTQKAKIASWLSEAKTHIKNNRYTSPKNNNAFDIYNKLLKQEPGNRQALEGIKNIQQHYASLFKRHISASQLTKAKSDISIMKKISAPSSIIKRMQATLKNSQQKKSAKAAKPAKPVSPPKKRTTKQLNIEKVSKIIGQFKSAIQDRSKKKLKQMSQYVPGREQFINQLLGQYRSINVKISNLQFIPKENKAQAHVELTELIDINDNKVTPGNWSKFEITVRYNSRNRLKVYW